MWIILFRCLCIGGIMLELLFLGWLWYSISEQTGVDLMDVIRTVMAIL